MSGLRAVLDRATATGHPRPRLVSRGYRLDVSPQECDADVFEQLVAGGRTALAAGDWAVAAGQLARGLALWRGDVLAGLEPYEWSLAYTTRLEQARLAAIEDWVEAWSMLSLFRHDGVAALGIRLEARMLLSFAERPG
ncbi:BTAD domain-containing putative transcriptional regulator [Polymorphospora sp. NPDC051019]|uniref:AfsR/SARP family transcriptional regulator n=1 Tax=Polymorphospora sp. NPDC051019 TaxID=3155725 RepID=UPI00342A2D6E